MTTSTRPASTAAAIRFTVPGNPVPKGRPRFVKRSGVVYTPPSTAQAEARVRMYLKASYPHLKPSAEPFGLSLRCYLSGTGRGDTDNYWKLVADACQGFLYLNDKQVRTACVTLFDHCKEPRTEIIAWELRP